MSDFAVTALLIASLFLHPGAAASGSASTLSGVAWIGMQLFSSRPAGDAMAVTIWGSASSWTLTALPLFVWMGEILFRTRLSRGHVPRPGAVDAAAARAPAAHQRGRLRDLRRGLGLERRHLRDDRQDEPARAGAARLSRPDGARLAGRRRHARPADPALDHHDRLRRHRRRLDLAALHRRRDPGHRAGRHLLALHRRLVDQEQAPDPARRPADDLRREGARIEEPDPRGAADRGRARLDLHRRRHRDRSGGARRGRLARHLGRAGVDELADVQGLADGRHAPLLHDRADPRRRRVPDAQHGLHRPAAPPRRVDRGARAQQVRR